MAFGIGEALGLGSNILGGIFGNKAAKQQKKMMREMREAAWKSFSGIDVGGVGGSGVSFQSGPDGITGINLSAGNLDPLQGALAQWLTGSGMDQLATANQINPLFQQGMDLAAGLQGDTNSQFQQSLMAQMDPIASQIAGLQDPNSLFGANAQAAMFGQGQDFLRQAQDFDSVYNSQLGLLRESARPGEERAGAQFLERMYGSGNIGTTGGARNAAEFNLGLERADIDRQLQAHGLSTQRQNQLFGQGMSLFGQAQGMAGLQDTLLGNALSRFQGLNQLSADMSQQRFQNNTGIAGLQAQLGQTAGMLPFQQQAAAMGLLNTGLQGQVNLQNLAAMPAEIALQFMTNQANARNSLAGQAGNFVKYAGGGAAGWGDLFTGLGQAPSGGWISQIFS